MGEDVTGGGGGVTRDGGGDGRRGRSVSRGGGV